MRRIIGLVFLIFSTIEMLGQITVSGKIKDLHDKSPLSGANILIKDTNIGTISDAKGNFELESDTVPFTIQISYFGYLTENIEIVESVNLTIFMTENIEFIEELSANYAKTTKHALDFGYVGDINNAPTGFIANYSLQSISDLNFDINTSFKYWTNGQNNCGFEFSVNKDLTKKINYLPDNLHISMVNIEYIDKSFYLNQFKTMLSNEWRLLSFSYGGSYSEYENKKQDHFSVLLGFSKRFYPSGIIGDAGLNTTIQYHPDRLYYDFGVYKAFWIKDYTTISVFAKYFNYEDIKGIMLSLRFNIISTRYYCCSSWKPYYHSINVLK